MKKSISFHKEFLLLLKKNFLLYRRKGIAAILELFVPFYIVFWGWVLSTVFNGDYYHIPAIPPSNPLDLDTVYYYYC